MNINWLDARTHFLVAYSTTLKPAAIRSSQNPLNQSLRCCNDSQPDSHARSGVKLLNSGTSAHDGWPLERSCEHNSLLRNLSHSSSSDKSRYGPFPHRSSRYAIMVKRTTLSENVKYQMQRAPTRSRLYRYRTTFSRARFFNLFSQPSTRQTSPHRPERALRSRPSPRATPAAEETENRKINLTMTNCRPMVHSQPVTPNGESENDNRTSRRRNTRYGRQRKRH